MITLLLPSTPERKHKLAKAIDSVNRSVCNQPIEILTDISEEEGSVKPTLRLLEKANDLVMWYNDDLTVESYTFQNLYDALMREFPKLDGIVLPVESDFFLCHASILREYLYPGYIHNYSDREIYDILSAEGRTHRVENAIIRHHHPIYEKNSRLLDRTYAWATGHREEDRILYEKRKAEGFPRWK